MKLEAPIFGVSEATTLPRDVFDRLIQLQIAVDAWTSTGGPSCRISDTVSAAGGIALDLGFLGLLDSTFQSGADGYDILLQTREKYMDLHRLGQGLEMTFKDLITASPSRGVMRRLLDALTQHGHAVSYCLFRAQQVGALLARWRSQDHETVRIALREVCVYTAVE